MLNIYDDLCLKNFGFYGIINYELLKFDNMPLIISYRLKLFKALPTKLDTTTKQ